MRVYRFQKLVQTRARAFIRGQRAGGERFGVEDSFASALATVAWQPACTPTVVYVQHEQPLSFTQGVDEVRY